MNKLIKLVHLCKDVYKSFFISFLTKEEDKFRYIYKKKYWLNPKGKSLSGSGSSLSASENIIKELSAFIIENKVSSILDIPCGDWKWMSNINLSNINYFGGDIVQEIIDDNNKKHSSQKVNFIKSNLMRDKLISSDLLIVRDLLVHLKDEDIFKCLDNIRRHDFKYIGLTHYPATIENKEKFFGDRWRPLNLLIKPFEMNKPDFILSDNSKDNGIDEGRTLAVWSKQNF